jgi:hypothetical protein
MTFVFLCTNAFSQRMMTQTNLLGKLALRGNKVKIIIDKCPNGEFVKYCKDFDIDIIEYHSTAWVTSFRYQKFRRFVYENIKSNPALLSFYLKGKNSKSTYTRLEFQIYYVVFKVTSFLPYLRVIFRAIEEKILVDKKAIRFLQKFGKSILISTYPANPQEGILLRTSKSLNWTSVIQFLSWDNITTKGMPYHVADFYLSWGQFMTDDILNNYFVKRDNIINTGPPHFDLYSKQCELVEIELPGRHKLKAGDKFLLFVMSSVYNAPGEIEIIERISRWIEDGKFGELKLLIRVHPLNLAGENKSTSMIERLINIQSSKVHLDYPIISDNEQSWMMSQQDMYRLKFSIANSLVVINSGSTVAIESLILKKNVILTLFDGEQLQPWHDSASRVYFHIDRLIKNGGIDVATSYESLKVILKKTTDNLISALNVEGQANASKHCGEIDGESTNRVVDELVRISKL